MKKIFLFCAAVVAAMTMNAQQVMTCDEAYDAAMALQNGDTLKVDGAQVTVEVTAFVTNGGNGQLSSGKQTFYIGASADETEKTIQAYKCTMPVDAEAVNKGDKVKITGKLMHYVNGSGTVNVAEFVNASAEILEKMIIKVDTISDLSVCEIIEEGMSLNAGEYSSDFFEVKATIDSLTYTNQSKKQQSFFIFCEDGRRLQIYNGAMQDDILGAEHDTVIVLGKIMHFVQGEKNLVEFESPKVWVVGQYTAVYDTIDATVAEAVAVGKALSDNAKTEDVYAVTGYVDSIAYEFKNGTMSFFMTDDMENPTYEFEAYSVNVTEEQANLIVVGRKVKVTSFLQHYVKAASGEKPAVDLVETVSGGAVEIVWPEGINNVRDNEQTIKRIENGQVVIIRNNVKYNALGVEVK